MITITGAQAQAINEARNTIKAIAQAYTLEQEARDIIKQTIASRPEFDINELLYNAEEVASIVSDDLFDEFYDDRVSDIIAEQVHNPEQASARETIARERLCIESDLVRDIMGEMCMNYDDMVDHYARNEWAEVEAFILQYLASDYGTILEVIAEMTAEDNEQD